MDICVIPLHYGFIGVDVFMLLSGYGLCYAWNKWNHRDFYIRRISRIYPLFILLATIKLLLSENTLSTTLCEKAISWILSVSTLSYYGIGGVFVDWYVCALLLLYALFPIIYQFICRTRLIGVVILTLVTGLSTICFDLHWSYECLLGRVPIFSIGILMYIMRDQLTDKAIIYTCMSMAILAVINTVVLHNNRVLTTALLCPWLIMLIVKICDRSSVLTTTFSRIGKYSYELYIANWLVISVIGLIDYNGSVMMYLLTYILFSVIFSGLTIAINHTLNRILANKLILDFHSRL